MSEHPAIPDPVPVANQHQLYSAIKYVLASFASGVTAIHGDKILAGAELVPGNVPGFEKAMGIPAAQADRNVLLHFAKVTSGRSARDIDAIVEVYAHHPGVTSESLAGCKALKDLCEHGLCSLTKRQRQIIMRRQRRVLVRVMRLLRKDASALKFVQTLVGLGLFATAGWLQWTATERAWKIGSWAAVCIGVIRLAGNVMYNEAGTIHQGWKLQYTHLGMAVVTYALEVLSRCGVEVEANNTTIIASTLASLIPILGYYIRNIENTIEDGIYKFENRQTGGCSEADAALLQPVLNKLRSFSTTSADALAEGSANRPGNRAAATAKEAEVEIDNLADLLGLHVDPTSTTWKEFFLSLLHETVQKAPSLIFAMATGIILVAAAIGNVRALSDNIALLMIIIIESALGIKNSKLTPEQLQYRLLVLILGRFGTIFFFAIPMIHEYRITGRRDIFDRDPELAAAMTHCNAAFVCLLGLAVVPSIQLFNRLIAKGFKRAFR